MPANITPRASTGVAFGNSVLQTAGWCGLVSALVCLFAVLNFVPPVAVYYSCKTQIILSPERVKQLEDALLQSTASAMVNAGEDSVFEDAGRLIKVERLDQLQQVASEAGTASEAGLLLVEVTSRWPTQQPLESLYRWIETKSAAQVKRDDANLARQLRFNRWKVAASQHYVERHQYVEASKQPIAPSNSRTFQLASAVLGEQVPAGATEQQKVADELSIQVEQAQRSLAASLAKWEHHVDSESGAFRPAGRYAIEAKPTRIPPHFAASLLVLGLATGSIAGWMQFRLQSGGAHAPDAVALQLARDGLPCVGNVVLPGADEAAGIPIARRLVTGIRNLPKQFAQRFSRLSELALIAWCGLIVFRLLADPLWRDVLASSPLAAFGRLISGLP